MRYNCHINVEVCSSIKGVKYLYKYVYKGTDCTSFAVENKNESDLVEINEIKQYRKARFITAIEAIYKLYRFPMYSMSPPVLQMQVHLSGMHMVPFNDGDNLEDVVQLKRPGFPKGEPESLYRRDSPGSVAITYITHFRQ